MKSLIDLAPWIGMILLMSAHLVSLATTGRADILRPAPGTSKLRLQQRRSCYRATRIQLTPASGAAPGAAKL